MGDRYIRGYAEIRRTLAAWGFEVSERQLRRYANNLEAPLPIRKLGERIVITTRDNLYRWLAECLEEGGGQ